jgi:hypothetical protein
VPYRAARARFAAEVLTLPLWDRAQRDKALVSATYIAHIDFTKVILLAVLALRFGIALASALSCRERPPWTADDSDNLFDTSARIVHVRVQFTAQPDSRRWPLFLKF